MALLDLGKRDQALPHLEAAAAARPDDGEVRDALRAANYDREDWLGEAERLHQAGGEGGLGDGGAHHAARRAHLSARGAGGSGVHRGAAARSSPTSRSTSRRTSCSRARSARSKRFDEIVKLHENRAFACADEREQAELYRRFASMWALRWNDVERSAHFYRKALQAYYGDGRRQGAQFLGHLAAFGFLREIEGAKGEWEKLLAIADLGLRAGLTEDEQAILATQAGVISWKEMKDSEKAQGLLRAGAAHQPGLRRAARVHARHRRRRTSRWRRRAPTR